MDKLNDLRLAVLIDAENISHSYIKRMMEEIAKYGTPTFKRIYGDWTRPQLTGWKAVLLENAVAPIQQYSYTSGKNSTDSALIIDAMDILYSGRVDGFCLVSSDSDFTRLATRLREAGMKVFGIGEKKTPTPFISACDKFIYLEILTENKPDSPGSSRSRAQNQGTGLTVRKADKTLVRMIADSINDLADEEGWAFMGELGSLLLKKKTDFDPRNYGFKKLFPLIKSLEEFEVDERGTGKGNITLVVRNK